MWNSCASGHNGRFKFSDYKNIRCRNWRSQWYNNPSTHLNNNICFFLIEACSLSIYIIYPNLTGGLIFKKLKFLRLKELLVFLKDMGQIVKIRKPRIKKNVGKFKNTSIWLWRNLMYPIASISTDAVSVCQILHPHAKLTSFCISKITHNYINDKSLPHFFFLNENNNLYST